MPVSTTAMVTSWPDQPAAHADAALCCSGPSDRRNSDVLYCVGTGAGVGLGAGPGVGEGVGVGAGVGAGEGAGGGLGVLIVPPPPPPPQALTSASAESAAPPRKTQRKVQLAVIDPSRGDPAESLLCRNDVIRLGAIVSIAGETRAQHTLPQSPSRSTRHSPMPIEPAMNLKSFKDLR